MCAHGVYRRFGGRTISRHSALFGLIALGTLTGAMSAPLTTVLMFLKNAFHAHVFPDYPLPILLAMLERLPAWTVAGALCGVAAALLIRRDHPGDDAPG